MRTDVECCHKCGIAITPDENNTVTTNPDWPEDRAVRFLYHHTCWASLSAEPPLLVETMTTSAAGGMKATKRQRYDLLPKAGLDSIAEAMAYGASSKYPDHNWRKGFEWSKSYAAAMRHMTAHWDGETVDDESGLPHLSHAGCHILFMLTWLHEQGEGGQFDDRFVNPSNKS